MTCKQMLEEESQHHGLLRASDVFRKEVLKALRKPYDKEEHQNCREVMQAGSYIKHYPGQSGISFFRTRLICA